MNKKAAIIAGICIGFVWVMSLIFGVMGGVGAIASVFFFFMIYCMVRDDLV